MENDKYVIDNFSDEIRLNNTINHIKEKNINIINLSHCTGDNAMKK